MPWPCPWCRWTASRQGHPRPQDDGTCVLTVVHDRLEGAPRTAATVAGVVWMTVLSGLKTVLETGEPLA